MNDNSDAIWTAPPHPDWLSKLNQEGVYFDLQGVVALDEDSLLNQACAASGLDDFGDDLWREPFRVLIKALEEEAQLTLMGRLMARSDILIWLNTRLQVTDTFKRHPEILEEEVEAPMIIAGLPRSGTSILFELLAQDPEVGVPETWEAMMPCPPPEADSYDSDSRIQQAHGLVTQWNRVAPEFATMHEMGGRIPAECGHIMCGSFISDQIDALHQTPSYSMFRAQADYVPVYEYHKKVLQILQWKNPRTRWLLKAPAHLGQLAQLLKVYPDARLVQTHRDPIKCMASATSLMGTLYSMRSDQPFNAEMMEDILMGAATAQSLETVMDQREKGVVPESNIADSRYQDLMDDPMTCIEGIYRHFGMGLSDAARQRMLQYLESKPKGKFGKHAYEIDESKAKERALFKRYQEHFQVPDEV
jgi:Sulfotransferase family